MRLERLRLRLAAFASPAPVTTAAALAVVCLLAHCRLGPEPSTQREGYVTVLLDDSLDRYDKVLVRILAEGDSAQVVGVLWDGKLDAPRAIPSYRLEDGETRALSIRVQAWDAYGRLVLDEMISKADGRQIVTRTPIPKPSPRLASLSLSTGLLSPAFDPAVHGYSVSLPTSQTNIRFTAAPAYAPARIFVGTRLTEAGKPSQAVALDTGSNRITLTILAADTMDQYVVTALRAAPPPDTAKPDPVDTGMVDPPKPPVDTAFQAWEHKGMVLLRLPAPVGGSSSLAKDFPLLLRLDAANFRFREAADSGRDLRFADSRGKLLDHAIARWDASGQRAEIYIRCDTLAATLEAPTILMYWGNPEAADVSNPARVFPPSRGWTGVWHLEESGSGKQGEYLDATGNYPGTALGGFPTRTDGAVGNAQDFYVTKQGWIRIPTGYDPGEGRFSLNVWIYNEGRSDSYLFHKSLPTAGAQRFELDMSKGLGNFGFGSMNVRTQADFGPPTVAWMLLGLVCDGTSIRFFTNGVEKESYPLKLGGDPAGDVLLGVRNPLGEYGFPGKLDELWTYAGIRDAWYMRLLYENQKPGSTLATVSRL